jgi:two-component system OmpR family sensor kinase
MSEQDQAHAFDRFYRGRGDGEVDGSGLGLAIAKRAVLRSEGTISLESRVGQGTRFTIRIPRAH